MSANNYLLISKSRFTVKECDADTCDGVRIGKGKSLLDAIKIAEKYLKNNIVEYGIYFEK